jgi:CO dehydrogenase nickel-insertion accessory protein CooC1
MVVTHGRGGTGKSTGVRILKERADEAGRPVVIADADRTNATLGAFYEGVERPDHPDEKTVADWLDELVNTQAETRMSVQTVRGEPGPGRLATGRGHYAGRAALLRSGYR